MSPSIRSGIDLPMEEIGSICRRYGVRELALFGSALREDFRPDSDVDLLVTFQPGARIGFMDLAGLQIDLSDLLRRRVDVVPKEGLKPRIRQAVLESSRVIYEA